MEFVNKTSYTRAEDLKRLKFIQSAIVELNRPNAKILDVGCGNGNNSRQMASLGFDVLGIDISAKTIETARSLNTYPNLRFENIPAEELDIDDKFDAIICSEVVEHLHAPQPVVHTLSTLLKPDGVLLVTVPNGYGPREFFMTKPMQAAMKNKVTWSMVAGAKKALGYKGTTIQSEAEDLTHVQFFTKTSLKKLFESEGFELQAFGVTDFIESVLPYSMLANRVEALQRFDNWIADFLPQALSSGFVSAWTLKK
ncbi:MAG: methyltransferase domain-containing protein [Spirosoma sp.]|nr:methyltransferase domain-containing protein [Spirosoma sp.]